jgi:hypothetical protein
VYSPVCIFVSTQRSAWEEIVAEFVFGVYLCERNVTLVKDAHEKASFVKFLLPLC